MRPVHYQQMLYERYAAAGKTVAMALAAYDLQVIGRSSVYETQRQIIDTVEALGVVEVAYWALANLRSSSARPVVGFLTDLCQSVRDRVPFVPGPPIR